MQSDQSTERKKRKKKQTAHTTHLEFGITVTPRTFGQQDEFSEDNKPIGAKGKKRKEGSR
jgi:hypothetical protein